jgi:LPS-assembly protein
MLRWLNASLAAPNTTTYSARATFNLPQEGGNTTVNYFRTGSLTSAFSTNQDNFGITDNRSWAEKVRTDLTLNVTNSESKTITADATQFQATRQLDVDFSGTDEFNWATASLEYRRTIPMGHRESFFAGDDRTPVLALKSDARRLFGKKSGTKFPFTTEVSWGEMVNGQDQTRISRATFDFGFNRDDRRQNSRHQFGINGRFKQGIYSDDTAQYVLNGGLRYSYYIDRDTNFNLRYTYLRPYGFTPLSIDRSGRTHLLAADLSYRPWNSFMLRAQTGYDFLQLQKQNTPWQRISINSEYAPTDNFSFRTQTTYDTVSQVWQNVRMDLGWDMGQARLSMGTNYDGQRHTWSNFNLFADGFQIGKLRVGMIFSYNGYNRQVEARHFSFTYDLHCVEAILQIIDNPVGFRSGQSIMFFLRVKALPFDTPFGIGNRGQAVGSGSGIRF